MADDSALVVVEPSDSVDAIAQKVHDAGANSVELLVPDGTEALQALGGFARLRQSIERDRIGLLVISSDEKTLNAARLNQFDTVGVQGARVTLTPPVSNGGRAAPAIVPPVSDQDAQFLEQLDRVPARDRYSDLADDEDADLYAALDDLSDAIQSSASGKRSADEDFASELDDLSGAYQQAGAEAPRQRVRAEDLELDSADISRQRGARRTAAKRDRAEHRDVAKPKRAWRRGASARQLELEADEEAVFQRPAWLRVLIPAAIVAILILIGFWLFRSNQATITIGPPAGNATEHPFKNEVIPIATSANSAASTIMAQPVSSVAEITVQGQVAKETLTPVGTAKGTIAVLNTLTQPVELPQNTEFIAKNSQGQEVRFTLDVPAVVPAAAIRANLSGIDYGQIIVAITARSPGAASNIGDNAITHIVIPGQQPIASGGSNFIVQHGAIGGGTDEPQRVVTEAEVNGMLQKALTDLYNSRLAQLNSNIDTNRWAIDEETISPNAEQIADPANYERIVNPPIGTIVDPNNPTFNVTIKTTFNALAIPPGRSVKSQLQTAAQQHFQNKPNGLPCKQGETASFSNPVSRWDSARQALLIDGTITCTPPGALTSEAQTKVKGAIRGKSRDEAEVALRQLQREGVIGAYALPPGVESFPSFDPLLNVQFETTLKPQGKP